MKIGILGGTFDPLHNGHMAVAEEVHHKLALHEVLFVPAGQPWLKLDGLVSPAADRVQMVRLGIAGHPGFSLSTIEVDRPGPTYTVDTIAELRASLGADVELFFIVGWDNLAQLPRWRDPARLVEMCRLVAVPRPGYHLPDLKALAAVLPCLPASLILLDHPHVDIGATDIRRRLAAGESVHGLVPDVVERYIQERRLYRPVPERGGDGRA